MYSPILGCFLSRDPLPSLNGAPDLLYDNNWFGQRLDLMRSLYGYAYDNPVNFVDPTGLEPEYIDEIVFARPQLPRMPKKNPFQLPHCIPKSKFKQYRDECTGQKPKLVKTVAKPGDCQGLDIVERIIYGPVKPAPEGTVPNERQQEAPNGGGPALGDPRGVPIGKVYDCYTCAGYRTPRPKQQKCRLDRETMTCQATDPEI